MKNIKKYSALLICLFFAYSSGYGQGFKNQRVVKTIYPCNKGAVVQISNKYGDIHVENWDKDSVKFEIRIQAEAKTLEKLDYTFNSISTQIVNNEYYITASTVFGNKTNTVLDDITDFGGNLFNVPNTSKIDYKVWMPNNLELDIVNKFGNIYLNKHQGDLQITLSNGALKVGSVTGKADFKLSFASGIISHVKSAKFELNYVDNFQLFKADYVSLKSTSSDIKIREIKKINIDSKRDEIEIKKVEKIQGRCSFSTIEIEELGSSLKMNFRYGDLDIEEIKNTFQSMNLVGYYTDIIVDIGNERSYSFDIIGNNTMINIPDEIKYTKTLMVDDPKSFKIVGKTGGANTNAKITGKLKSGSFSLTN